MSRKQRKGNSRAQLRWFFPLPHLCEAFSPLCVFSGNAFTGVPKNIPCKCSLLNDCHYNYVFTCVCDCIQRCICGGRETMCRSRWGSGYWTQIFRLYDKYLYLPTEPTGLSSFAHFLSQWSWQSNVAIIISIKYHYIKGLIYSLGLTLMAWSLLKALPLSVMLGTWPLTSAPFAGILHTQTITGYVIFYP